jgi:hypothetical protein
MKKIAEINKLRIKYCLDSERYYLYSPDKRLIATSLYLRKIKEIALQTKDYIKRERRKYLA